MTKTVLPPIRKTVILPSFRSGRRECWEAVTVDGQWLFVRDESPGTPWLIYHQKDPDPVVMTSTLTRCRQYAARSM